MTPLDFSVVVPTRNRPAQLRELLRCLAAQHLPRDRFEVIVVDDASETPLTGVIAPFATELTLRLLRVSHRGCGPARQAGVDEARGRYLAFTDDDCRPEPDWLSRLGEALEGTPGCAVGGLTVNGLSGSVLSEATQWMVNRLAWRDHAGGDAEFAPSCNIAFPRAAFAAVGGLDRTWGNSGGEDRVLCLRWHDAGHRLLLVPGARVRHYHTFSFRHFLLLHVRYGTGAWLVHRRLGMQYERPRYYLGLLVGPFITYGVVRGAQVAAATLVAQVATGWGMLAGILGAAWASGRGRRGSMDARAVRQAKR